MLEKFNIKRIIYGIFVIIWMVTIFLFSSQNGEESQGTSDIITDKIVNVFVKIGINVVNDDVSFVVRKVAHFTAYFIGGILIYNFLNTFSINIRYIVIISVLFIVIYAISDELHQLFISNRSGQLRDVLIDSCGGILAVFLRRVVIKEIEEEKWKS